MPDSFNFAELLPLVPVAFDRLEGVVKRPLWHPEDFDFDHALVLGLPFQEGSEDDVAGPFTRLPAVHTDFRFNCVVVTVIAEGHGKQRVLEESP